MYRFKYIKIVLFALICFFLLSKCKKYSEDDKLSFQTAKKRINQTWKFNLMVVDDVDSTLVITSYFNLNSPNELAMECEGFKAGSTGSAFEISIPTNANYDHCEFDLFDKKRKLRLSSPRALFPTENFYTSEWIIKKLTNKYFIMEGYYKNKKYRYEFIK